ncbi:LmbE family N-acetylglucosaminyl deacetylase [Pseudomonas psychrotolerans]|nr:LmbE family N-acetylglucosaminyl deacetylase [Pseudomonas psychrotolerans]
MSKERVLVVAAHPDDEILGCGGAIARHKAQGDEVQVVIMAQGLYSRGTPQEAERIALQQASDEANRIL